MEIIITAIIAVVFPLILILLTKTFPAKVIPSSNVNLETLKPKYQKWENICTFLYIVFWVFLTLLLWFLLTTLSEWNGRWISKAHIIITADPFFLFLPALFLALVLAGLPVTWLSKYFLKQRFHEYETYLFLKFKFDPARIHRFLYWSIGILCALVIPLALNWYVFVGDDALVANRFFSLTEDRYPYKGILSIQKMSTILSEDGHLSYGPFTLVTFKDGRTWFSGRNNLPTQLDESRMDEFAQTLSVKSGAPLEMIETFEWK